MCKKKALHLSRKKNKKTLLCGANVEASLSLLKRWDASQVCGVIFFASSSSSLNLPHLICPCSDAAAERDALFEQGGGGYINHVRVRPAIQTQIKYLSFFQPFSWSSYLCCCWTHYEVQRAQFGNFLNNNSVDYYYKSKLKLPSPTSHQDTFVTVWHS